MVAGGAAVDGGQRRVIDGVVVEPAIETGGSASLHRGWDTRDAREVTVLIRPWPRGRQRVMRQLIAQGLSPGRPFSRVAEVDDGRVAVFLPTDPLTDTAGRLEDVDQRLLSYLDTSGLRARALGLLIAVPTLLSVISGGVFGMLLARTLPLAVIGAATLVAAVPVPFLAMAIQPPGPGGGLHAKGLRALATLAFMALVFGNWIGLLWLIVGAVWLGPFVLAGWGLWLLARRARRNR